MQKTIQFGFHTGSGGGNQTGIGDYYRLLNTAARPFFAMSADAFPFEAQQIALANPAVDHVVAFRRSVGHQGTVPPSGNPDLPEYMLSPAEASANHWGWHWARRPTEMHPDTWMLITNEPGSRLEFDREADARDVPLYGVREFYTRTTPEGQLKYGVTNAGWLAAYELETARHALQAGQRYAALGWAAGNPEPEDWEHPESLKMLRFYADHPDRLAIALHEYSWKTADIWFQNGRLVGRFIDIYNACCKHGIPYPAILITEWGWTYEDVPGTAVAMQHIREVAQYYAQFPEIKGAAIWYLGPGFGGIADKAQKLIEPLTQTILTTSVNVSELYPGLGECAGDEPPAPPADGRPRIQYRREYWVVPTSANPTTVAGIYEAAAARKITCGPSYDDAGIGALVDKTAVLWDIPDAERQTYRDWYAAHYPGTVVEFRAHELTPPIQGPILLAYRPCDTNRVTQEFGANPAYYEPYGLPGHEGIDYGVAAGLPYYAAAAGRVVFASDRKWSNAALASAYGWHVVLDHGTYTTVYAHARPNLPVKVGQHVNAGDIVGYSGNTGNSSGYHLHFGVMDKTGAVDPGNGYPTWTYGRPVNPAPYLSGLTPPPSAPPVPAGNAQIGLHASADPGELYGKTAEYDEFKLLKPGVIKVLSAHSASAIARLQADNPGAAWIVRAFLNFGGRVISPQQFVNDTLSDTRRAVEALTFRGVPASRIWVELHNEPNLVQEGWGASWANGREFGNWLTAVASLYRQALPGIPFLYPGLSPGGDIAGVRTDSARFTSESSAAVAVCDGLAVHCYWSGGWPMSTALTYLDAHQKYNKPVWVTEASRNDRPPSPIPPAAQYAAEYVQFWQECRKRPWVYGVTYYVASASNGYFAPECWIEDLGDGRRQSKGIAAAMRSIIGS